MPPLIMLALSAVPALVRLFAGERAGQVTDAVAGVVRTVTGTDDAALAEERLRADPAMLSTLQQRLAEIALDQERLRFEDADKARQAELATLRAQLEEVQDARGSMVQLAASGSLIAWGPVVVSLVVTTGFFGLLGLFMWWSPEKDRVDTQAWALLNIAVGALVAGFTAVVNFWIGSSQGSRDKDKAVEQLTAAALTSAGQATRTVANQAQAAQAAVTEAVSTTIAQARDMIGPSAPVGPPPNVPSVVQPPPPAAAPGPADTRGVRLRGSGDARFLPCLAVVLRHEGGFVNDPADPGGATNLGITKATLESWRGHPVTVEDVRELEEEEAREIYRGRYWNVLRCDQLPAGIDLMVFDFGVNAGPGAGARMLQRAVGVKADGAIGPITVAAAQAADPQRAIDQMARLREEHYRSLAGFERFGRGWLRRTDEVRRAAQAMAAAA